MSIFQLSREANKTYIEINPCACRWKSKDMDILSPRGREIMYSLQLNDAILRIIESCRCFTRCNTFLVSFDLITTFVCIYQRRSYVNLATFRGFLDIPSLNYRACALYRACWWVVVALALKGVVWACAGYCLEFGTYSLIYITPLAKGSSTMPYQHVVAAS